MKKRIDPKLKLTTERVRDLTAQQLGRVAGEGIGFDDSPLSGKPSCMPKL